MLCHATCETKPSAMASLQFRSFLARFIHHFHLNLVFPDFPGLFINVESCQRLYKIRAECKMSVAPRPPMSHPERTSLGRQQISVFCFMSSVSFDPSCGFHTELKECRPYDSQVSSPRMRSKVMFLFLIVGVCSTLPPEPRFNLVGIPEPGSPTLRCRVIGGGDKTTFKLVYRIFIR